MSGVVEKMKESDKHDSRLVGLTFGFILVLSILIFMQVMHVGYFREMLAGGVGGVEKAADDAEAALVASYSAYMVARGNASAAASALVAKPEDTGLVAAKDAAARALYTAVSDLKKKVQAMAHAMDKLRGEPGSARSERATKVSDCRASTKGKGVRAFVSCLRAPTEHMSSTVGAKWNARVALVKQCHAAAASGGLTGFKKAEAYVKCASARPTQENQIDISHYKLLGQEQMCDPMLHGADCILLNQSGYSP
jgi:hypothetical protein